MPFRQRYAALLISLSLIVECDLFLEIYLLAFGPLRSVFDGHELQSLGDLMVERGLRMRKGLYEVVGDADKTIVDDHNGEEDAIDEIEHNAEELRRLMPY